MWDEGSEIDIADEPFSCEAEMSTTDVSDDMADADESDSDDQHATGSADAEAAAIDAVVAAVAIADSIEQVEDMVDKFLAREGTLSSETAHRIDLALQERTNDVSFAKLQQSLFAGPTAVELLVALWSFEPGDWEKSP